MFIRKDSRYTEKDAAVVVRQMLKVAAECHLHGLVHRDMKPEVCSNLLAYLSNMELYMLLYIKYFPPYTQNFLFKSTREDSPLKATDFGLSDFIKPGEQKYLN